MSGLSTIFKMAVKAAAAPNKKLLDMKYTRETPKTKEGFSSVDLAAEGKITDQEAIGGLFNPISFGKDGMKVGKDASNLNTSRIEISTFDPASTPGPLGFGMKTADDIGLPSTAVGNKTKDAIKVQTNLIEGSKWKWEGKVPKGFENNTHLVSMQGGSKLKKASGGPTDHSYATKVIYEKGGNLSTYDTRAKYVKELHKSIPESLAALKIKIPKEVEKLTKELKAKGKSTEEIKKRVDSLKKKLTRDYKGDNPKGKPTTVGVPEFGTKIGEIKKGGIIQPVYDQIIMREEGGQVMPMQYGGGLSNAYSTLSERRQNQNMYGMGDAPMQQMPSQMSSVFQDPMESSAFSPVNMEQGGDIVVPTIYRSNGGGMDDDYSESDLSDAGFDEGDFSYGDDGSGGYNYEFNEQGGYNYRDDPNAQGPTDTGYTGEDGSPTLSDYYTDRFGRELGSQLASGPTGTLGAVRNLTRSEDGLKFLREADKELGRRNFTPGRYGTIQRGIDRDLYNKAGIPLANLLEEGGLATFGKGMRGPYEAYTPGDAVYRDLEDKGQEATGRGEYDPEALVGNADLSNNPNKAAIQAFNNGLRYSKSGDTVADVTQSMKDSGRFSDAEISSAAATMGYSSNSSAQASQVYDSLNDARISGAIQGLGLITGAAASPAGFLNQLMSSYGEDGKTTTPIDTAFSTAANKLGITNILGENNKTLDTAGKVINLAQRGPGALFDSYDPSRRSVINEGPVDPTIMARDVEQAEQARQADIAFGRQSQEDISKDVDLRDKEVFETKDSIFPNLGGYTNNFSGFVGDPDPTNIGRLTKDGAENTLSLGSLAPDPRETPEQNMFAKGISSVVDFFGGPEAASRNNIDTSFGSGNDQPERRRVVQAAVPTPSPVKEDEELTGIKGLLARRKPAASRRDSNKFSKLLLSSLYPNQNINLG